MRRKRISLVKALQMLPQDVTEKWNICVTDFSLQYVKLTYMELDATILSFQKHIIIMIFFIKSLINQFILFSSSPTSPSFPAYQLGSGNDIAVRQEENVLLC